MVRATQRFGENGTMSSTAGPDSAGPTANVPNVLAARYASGPMAELWSPEHKVVAERQLWIAVMRAQAELENFRKRSRREYEDALRYREIDLLRDLLPVLDTVRRAIDASETTADVDSLRAGFRMTAQQLEKVLDTHGCKTIETEGKPFDPTVHDALLQQVVPGVAAGTVVGVASKGYKLHDRVVRPAQVIVSKEE